jgi:phage tail sheath gpL-like
MPQDGGINFTYYPTSNRVPGVYVEMDPSQANTATALQRTLMLGQRSAGGTGTPNVAHEVQSLVQAQRLCGIDSMLTGMVEAYLAADQFADLWIVPLDDDPAGVASTGQVTITGNATEAGTINLYIAGTLYQAAVDVGDAGDQIAGELTQAINQDPYSIVNASRPGGANTVQLLANFKGGLGDQIDIRLNYLGSAGGEWTPTGLTIDLDQPTGGTTDPDISTALANLSDQTYDFIIMPYTDPANLNAMENFLSDANGRWSWAQMLYGGCFTARNGSLGLLTTFGNGRNDQHVSVMGYFNAPDPPWIWAAQVGGYCAASLRVDPGLPLQYIGTTLKPPAIADRFTLAERNTLLYDGISTFRVSDAGIVTIERMCTTYQQNAAGAPDNSYLDVETMYGLMFVARDLTNYLLTRYARKKLVSDQTIVQPGSNCVTTTMIAASIVSEYRALEAAGYVQNSTNFQAGLIVENAGGGLVKVLAPVDLVNQLRQIAILMQFRKS